MILYSNQNQESRRLLYDRFTRMIDKELIEYVKKNSKKTLSYYFNKDIYINKICVNFMNSGYNVPWLPLEECVDEYLEAINLNKR